MSLNTSANPVILSDTEANPVMQSDTSANPVILSEAKNLGDSSLRSEWQGLQ